MERQNYFIQQIITEILSNRLKQEKKQGNSCSLVSVIGGGQIIGKNGAMKTILAETLYHKLKKTDPKLKVEMLSTNAYLIISFEEALRGATPNQYDFERMVYDIQTIKKDRGITVTDLVGGTCVQRTIGPKIDILIFEGVCSVWEQDLRRMTDVCIGVIEATDQDNLNREMEWLGEQGYGVPEVLNIFALTQFTVRKDVLARELREKTDFVLRLDESPPQMYQRRR